MNQYAKEGFHGTVWYKIKQWFLSPWWIVIGTNTLPWMIDQWKKGKLPILCSAKVII